MQRLPMRKIKEALRLKAAGLTQREIAASLGVGRTTVGEYLDRAARAGLIWPLPDEMDDSALERRLFASAGGDQSQARPQPDWQHIHGELRRKSVTLRLLWEEYRAVHPDGYGYSQFCERYRQWKGRLSPTMRQTHAPGERLFVDYAGQTIEFVDGLTGEVVACQLFVAVLGASSYTYAEATRTQSLTDWCSSHEHAFTFFGAFRHRSSPTTSRPASPRPASTNRLSTGPMPTLRRITTPPSSQPDPTSHVTRRRWRSASCSPNVGSSPS